MRLRNIPRAEGTIQAHHAVIKRPEAQRGCWQQVFGNKHPIYIEIGMGKGRFIIKEIAGTTRSGRPILTIEKYV